MFQGLFFQLAGVAIQHRDRLLSSVQIASYNFHLGLLRSELCTLDTAQFIRLVARPTSLCHHLSGPNRSSPRAKPSFRLRDYTSTWVLNGMQPEQTVEIIRISTRQWGRRALPAAREYSKQVERHR